MCLNSCCSYTTEANLIKLHRKKKHNEKVCHAHDFGSYAQGQGHNQVRGQNRVSAITKKTTEANLTKLHRKIFLRPRSNHSYVSGQIVPKIMLLINYCSGFDETSQKDKA